MRVTRVGELRNVYTGNVKRYRRRSEDTKCIIQKKCVRVQTGQDTGYWRAVVCKLMNLLVA